MWIYLPWGFFSVIRYRNEPLVTIRARRKRDLERLREAYLPLMSDIAVDSGADYIYRAKASPLEFATAVARIILELNWSNVKAAAAVVGGPELTNVYHQVHLATKQLDDLRPGAAARSWDLPFLEDEGPVGSPSAAFQPQPRKAAKSRTRRQAQRTGLAALDRL